MKHLYLLFLLGANLVFGQLQPFTINVTPSPETCNRNGTLSWTVENRTEGSTITYSIYHLPDENNALAPTEQMKISGLKAGEYKVVATQSDGNQSNFASQTVTIEDQTIPVQFDLDIKNEYCGNDGKVTISVTSGTAPYVYQLLDDNNTPTLTQNDNTITGLTAGAYKVRVNDACGKGLVKEFVIDKIDPNPTETIVKFGSISCRPYIYVKESFSSNSLLKSVTIKISYTNPETGELIEQERNHTRYIPSYENYYSTQIFLTHNFPGETITYNYTITDECGNERSGTFDALNVECDMEISEYKPIYNSCGKSTGFTIHVKSINNSDAVLRADKITFTSLPTGMTKEKLGIGITNYFPTEGIGRVHIYAKQGIEKGDIPQGLYEGYFDLNGKHIHFSYNYIKSSQPVEPSYYHIHTNEYEGCGKKYIDFYISTRGGGRVKNLIFLDFPPNTKYQKSYNSDTNYIIYDLPKGTYTVRIINNCGETKDVTFSVKYPTIPDAKVKVIPVCGAFNLEYEKKYLHRLYIQIYDENLGDWTTPSTKYNREPYQPSSENRISRKQGYFIHDNSTLSLATNFQFDGKFRIIEERDLKVYDSERQFTDGKTYICRKVVKEFEFSEQPIINQINSFRCSDGTYNVGMHPKGGTAPYTYQIVKDVNSIADDNIITNNGNQPIFSGLTPGVYLFRVLDSCGNYITSEYEITTLGAPKIRTIANCENQTVQFIIDGVDYLDFKWYKEGDENTTLSNTNSLDLGTFSADKAGTYRLHITSNLAGACIDEVLSVRISENPFTAPHAGLDNSATVCPSRSIFLGEYLRESNPGEGVDSNGKWERVNKANDAGALVGDEWFANLAAPGVYEFRYVVKGLCSGEDVATITINTRDVEAPTVSSCPGNITVNSNSINDIATATWTIPTFDGCRLKVTSDKKPGDTFPIGDTDVTYTAEDQNGNTAICKFTVTVNRFTCAKKPNTSAPQGNVKVGISNLNRTTQTNQWINSYNDGWIAMESRTKGFVITRADDVNHPETAIENPVEGMIVFDIDENCIKLYDGTKWDCVAQGCDNDTPSSNP